MSAAEQTTPKRGDVQTDNDGSRWIVLMPPVTVNGRPSRVREGSNAATVIFDTIPDKPLALRKPSFDF